VRPQRSTHTCGSRNYLAESLWSVESGGPLAVEVELLKLLATRPQTDDDLIPGNLPPDERRMRQLALDHLHDQSLIRHVTAGWELTIPLYQRWIQRYILGLPAESRQPGNGDQPGAGTVAPALYAGEGAPTGES
jgi:hypothetical protein